MDPLMPHVERIVHPIRASQSRKLRMRLELLAHLQSAHDEERAAHPNDPADALPRALARLGPPDALTAQLQQSVPALERLLLAPFPMSARLARWESQSHRLLGADHPFTLPHGLLHAAAAIALPHAALLILVLRAGHPNTYLAALLQHPALFLLSNLFFLIAVLSIYVSAGRLITAAASPNYRRLLTHASLVTTLCTLTLVTCVLFLARRPLTLSDLATAALVIPSLLLSLSLTGRLLAHLQRPYTPWLALSPTP